MYLNFAEICCAFFDADREFRRLRAATRDAVPRPCELFEKSSIKNFYKTQTGFPDKLSSSGKSTRCRQFADKVSYSAICSCQERCERLIMGEGKLLFSFPQAPIFSAFLMLTGSFAACGQRRGTLPPDPASFLKKARSKTFIRHRQGFPTS